MSKKAAPVLRTICFSVVLCLGIFGMAFPVFSQAGSVYVIQIEGEIERGLAAYVDRIISTAEEEGAANIIIRINTPGGTLDAALDIKDAILDTDIPTAAFVERQAFSAGALIAIAADEIYMEPGSSMGAATPISGATGETADEKTISAVRTAFASTAEANGRDPLVAEAMVDPAVQIEGLIESGRLLTLTTSQALEWGYAEGTADNFAGLLQELGLEDREVIQTGPSIAEGLVRWLTNSVVSSLLITIGFLALLFELISPGFGIGGIIGAVCLGLFFFGHYLAGLAGWEGIVLVIVGAVLIALEAFVIPGFGVAGVLGLIAFLGGLYISMVEDFSSTDQLLNAGYVVAASLVAIIVGTFLLLRFVPKKRSIGGLFLVDSLLPDRRPQPREGGPAAPEGERYSMVGSRGIAMTPLRPAGVAEIEGKRIDVVTEGDWIERGSTVEVILDTGYRRVVQAVPGDSTDTAAKAD